MRQRCRIKACCLGIAEESGIPMSLLDYGRQDDLWRGDDYLFHHDRPESVQGQYASLKEEETLLRQARDRLARGNKSTQLSPYRPSREAYARWQAAVTIQKMWRGALGRQKAMDRWIAVYQIQRFWRGALVRYRMARWRGRPIGPVRKEKAARQRANERELARQKRAEERERRRLRENAEVNAILARVESVRRGVIQTPSASGTPRSSYGGFAYSPNSTFGSAPATEEPVTPTAMVLTPTSTMRSDAPSIDPMPGQTMEVPIQMRDGSVQMLPVMVMPQDSAHRKQRNASVEETANFLMSLASSKASGIGEVESTKFLMELADQTLRMPTPDVDLGSTVASTSISLASPGRNAGLGDTPATPTKPTPPPAAMSARRSHPGSLRGVYQRVKERASGDPSRTADGDASGAGAARRDSFLSVPEGPSSAPPSASRRNNNLPPDMDDYATYVSPEPTPPPQPQRRPRERFAEAVEDATKAAKAREVTARAGEVAAAATAAESTSSPEAAKIAELQGLIAELDAVQRELLHEIHAEFPEVESAARRSTRRPPAAQLSAPGPPREISFAPTPSPVRAMRERRKAAEEEDAMERYAAMLAGTMEREREAGGGTAGGGVSPAHYDPKPAHSGRARPAARFTPASASRRSSLGSVHGSAGATPARRRPGSRDPGMAAAAAARRRAIEVEDEEEARISQRLGRVYLAGESRTRHANALVSKYAVNGRAGESMGDSGRRGGAARAGSRGSPASILDTLRSDASDPYEAYESHSYSSHKPAGIGNFWEIRQGIAREFHSGH